MPPPQQQQTRCCDGCGLGPFRNSSNGQLIPLRSCSRCHRAWYHSVDCQRKHYPVHRKQCKKTTTTTRNNNKQQQQLVRVEERPGRGNCLVACRHVDQGQPIETLGFAPLVPPVLVSSMRESRCAVCFGRLQHQNRHDHDHDDCLPEYKLCFCSKTCADQTWVKEEKEIVYRVAKQQTRMRFLPTAILVFRLVKKIMEERKNHIAAVAADTLGVVMDKLKMHPIPPFGDEFQHCRAVIMVVQALLLHSNHGSLSSDDDYLAAIVSKVKVNSFSVCDGEFQTLGIGLFGTVASSMNHACSPNALAAFVYGVPGRVPRLRVTACLPISANAEICLSYIDVAANLFERRELLQSTYHFWCACCNNHDNNELVAWRGPCRTAWLQQYNLVSNNNNHDLTRLRKLFRQGETFFFPHSLLFQECGEALLKCLLLLDDDAMLEAYNVIQSLLRGHNGKGFMVLRGLLLRFKKAKLGLCLGQTNQAIQELLAVRKQLEMYYSPNHEIIRDLDAVLQQS